MSLLLGRPPLEKMTMIKGCVLYETMCLCVVVFQSSVSIVVCKFIKFSLCFFPVYLIEDESVEVGVMNLTVECLAALKAVSEEMAAAADDSQ